jgi:hypothetical protein
MRSPLLRSSLLAHLVWRISAKRYSRRADQLRDEDQQAARLRWRHLEPALGPDDYEAKRNRYFELLTDLIRDSHWIATKQNKSFFEFIQPNFHVEGSKPLSEEERRLAAISPLPYSNVTPMYARLEKMVSTLHAEGIQAHSMVQLFHDRPETLYIDNCCHLNDRGLTLLMNAIADRVLANLPKTQ